VSLDVCAKAVLKNKRANKNVNRVRVIIDMRVLLLLIKRHKRKLTPGKPG
jgi:hypothetical protein